jgi:hypothetical protein
VPQITNDEFQIWKENEVTKALIDEIKKSIQEKREVKIASYDPSTVLALNAEKNAVVDTLEQILNWSPVNE